MEVVLGGWDDIVLVTQVNGLNPCFSGSCSWRDISAITKFEESLVLILVLVEVVLGERI